MTISTEELQSVLDETWTVGDEHDALRMHEHLTWLLIRREEQYGDEWFTELKPFSDAVDHSRECHEGQYCEFEWKAEKHEEGTTNEMAVRTAEETAKYFGWTEGEPNLYRAMESVNSEHAKVMSSLRDGLIRKYAKEYVEGHIDLVFRSLGNQLRTMIPFNDVYYDRQMLDGWYMGQADAIAVLESEIEIENNWRKNAD